MSGSRDGSCSDRAAARIRPAVKSSSVLRFDPVPSPHDKQEVCQAVSNVTHVHRWHPWPILIDALPPIGIDRRLGRSVSSENRACQTRSCKRRPPCSWGWVRPKLHDSSLQGFSGAERPEALRSFYNQGYRGVPVMFGVAKFLVLCPMGCENERESRKTNPSSGAHGRESRKTNPTSAARGRESRKTNPASGSLDRETRRTNPARQTNPMKTRRSANSR